MQRTNRDINPKHNFRHVRPEPSSNSKGNKTGNSQKIAKIVQMVRAITSKIDESGQPLLEIKVPSTPLQGYSLGQRSYLKILLGQSTGISEVVTDP